MINVYKSPISKEKYANLFLDKIPEGVKNVCLLFIGHSETVHYIMSQKPEIDFTVIDGSDVTEALPYIYTADNLKERITFEESDCEDETFLKKLETCFENYITNNMPFDLIVANPPYGKSSSLSKKIVNKMLESKTAEEYVVLAPFNTYVNTFTHIEDFTFLGATDQYFADAAVHGLSCTKLSNKEINKFKTWDDLLFSTVPTKLVHLKDAVVKYNETHKPFYKAMHPWVRRNAEKIKPLVVEENCFLCTVWQPQDKVHVDESAMDIKHNLNNKPIDWKKDDGGLIEFRTRKEFENFKDWFYRKPGHSEEAKKTFVYQALTLLDQVGNGGIPVTRYVIAFPNLDWSRPWTDAEILAEIGLPEDFLKLF